MAQDFRNSLVRTIGTGDSTILTAGDYDAVIGIRWCNILTSSIFGSLKNIKPGAGGEYQLTDAIKDLLNYEKVLATTYEGSKYDCGSKKGFVEATISIALATGELDKDKFNFLTSPINWI